MTVLIAEQFQHSEVSVTVEQFWIVDIAEQNLSCCVIGHDWLISQPVGVVPFSSLDIDRVQRHVDQHAHVERSQVSVLATSRFTETETLCASFGVLLLKVVSSISAVVALASLNVLLTEASLKRKTKI